VRPAPGIDPRVLTIDTEAMPTSPPLARPKIQAELISKALASVRRLDGRPPVEVLYATFTTTTAGMPLVATVPAPLAPA